MARGLRCMPIGSRRKRAAQIKAADKILCAGDNVSEIAASVTQCARNKALGKDSSDKVMKNPPAAAFVSATVETKTAAKSVETKTTAKEVATEIPLTAYGDACPERNKELAMPPQMEEMVGTTVATDGASTSIGDADAIPSESEEVVARRCPPAKSASSDFVGGEIAAELHARSVAHVVEKKTSNKKNSSISHAKQQPTSSLPKPAMMQHFIDPQSVMARDVAAQSTLTSAGIRSVAWDNGKDSATPMSRSGSVLGCVPDAKIEKNDKRTASRRRLRAPEDRSAIGGVAPTLGTALARLTGRAPPLACESAVECAPSVSVNKCDAAHKGSATDIGSLDESSAHVVEDKQEGPVRQNSAMEETLPTKVPSRGSVASMRELFSSNMAGNKDSTLKKSIETEDMCRNSTPEPVKNVADETAVAPSARASAEVIISSAPDVSLSVPSIKAEASSGETCLAEETSATSRRASLLQEEMAASSVRTPAKLRRGSLKDETPNASLSASESAILSENCLLEQEQVASRVQTPAKSNGDSLKDGTPTASLSVAESASLRKDSLLENEPTASSVRTPAKPRRGSFLKEETPNASLSVRESASLRKNSLVEEELAATSQRVNSYSRKNSLAEETPITPNVRCPRSRCGADRSSIGSSATSAATTCLSETKKHPDSTAKAKNTLARCGRSNTIPLSHAELLSALNGGAPAKAEKLFTDKAEKADKADKAGKADKGDKVDKANKSDKKDKKNRKDNVEKTRKTVKAEDKAAKGENVPAKAVREAKIGEMDKADKGGDASKTDGSMHDDPPAADVADPLNALTAVAAPTQTRTPTPIPTPITQTPPTSPLLAVVRTLPTPTNSSSSNKAMSPIRKMLTAKKLPKSSLLFNSPLPGPWATSSESASNGGRLSNGTNASESADTTCQKRSKEVTSDTSEGESTRRKDSDSQCTFRSSRVALAPRKAAVRSMLKAKSPKGAQGRHPIVMIKRKAKPPPRSHFPAASSSGVLSDGNDGNSAVNASPKTPRPNTPHAVRRNPDARYDTSVPPRRRASLLRVRKHRSSIGSSKRRVSIGSSKQRVSIGHRVRSMLNSPPSKQYANQQVSDAEWSSSNSGTEEEVDC
eukprot:GEMP01004692.1.p1 GENE.GEMP01004692.1~~GEMP01004692.1.p1  ORF type:complete len:1106 (+),score=241.20 GEMP01004692.1:3-3320(+)